MPFYAYECSCGHTQTIYKKIADCDKEEYCEKCGEILKRQISDYGCGYSNDKDFCGKFS